LSSNGNTYRVAAIEDVHFTSPLKFYRNQPRTLTWRALVSPEGQGLLADVTLESQREIKVKGTIQTSTHFSGRVHLEAINEQDNAEPPTTEVPSWNGETMVDPEAIYRVYFHGPAFQVLDGVNAYGERVIGKLRADLPPITKQAKETLIAPRLIELCLQTAGVWEIGKTGALALPTSIERVVVHRLQENGKRVYAEIVPRPALDTVNGSDQEAEVCFDARVIDEQGQVYLELLGYRTARLPEPVAGDQIAPLRVVVQEP
jgi:hypothetical protein